MSPTFSSVAQSVLTAALLASTSLGEARQGPAGFERELVLDVGRIAVQDSGADAARVAGQLSEFGIAAKDIVRWPIEGWWLVSVPDSARTGEGVHALVEAIALSSNLDFVTPVFVGDEAGPLFPTRDLLVRVADPASAERLGLDHGRFGTVRDREVGGMAGVFRIESPDRNGSRVLDAASVLARDADVIFAEPDMIFTGRGGHVPNDPGFPLCWGLDNTGQAGGTADMDMDGPEAWEHSLGSASVVVVVIDTGVQLDHPDLHQIPGTDTTSNGPGGGGGPRNAFESHGTTVAGCVSATIDNSLGTVGIAPGCVSASVRAFIGVASDGSWTTQASWTVDALAWAQSIGARVTNNSNVYGFQSSVIAAKYQDTWNAGIVHFACAGNDAASTLSYPASIPVVNSVMALQRQGQRASFSNIGPGIDFAAPGLDVYTTDRTGADGYESGDYATVFGTSYASPYAAGVAALVISKMPGASPALVEQILRDSCVDLGAPGYDTTFGHGFVNARRALIKTCDMPLVYCSTSPNSVGPGATMNHAGSPSISANDLTLIASNCPPNTAGLFYFGSMSTQAPFGNGFRCVAGVTFRIPVVVVNVFGDAVHALDIPSVPSAAGIAAGTTRLFQFWYRDPAGGGAGFNSSDGLQVKFCP